MALDEKEIVRHTLMQMRALGGNKPPDSEIRAAYNSVCHQLDELLATLEAMDKPERV